jgi:hypothetical protein
MARSSLTWRLIASVMVVASATVCHTSVASSDVVQVRNGDGAQNYYSQFSNSLPSVFVKIDIRYFPVEPHRFFPGLRFLPQRAHMGHSAVAAVAARPDPEQAPRDVLEVELVSKTEMKIRPQRTSAGLDEITHCGRLIGTLT